MPKLSFKGMNFLLLVVVLVSIEAMRPLGSRRPMTNEELQSHAILNLTSFAVNRIHSYNDCVQVNHQLLGGHSQIVSGVNYFFRIKLTPTPRESSSTCSTSALVSEICEVTVYEQPWTNTTNVTEFTCVQEATSNTP